ncbi:MAG: TIGR03751 family conjugal transfer lipoprotein [Gammaproteobacteria bacterium]|nr:TIGR03751 family conjugal transfer lipoprotein [Gammaproteobacteria bacterium]
MLSSKMPSDGITMQQAYSQALNNNDSTANDVESASTDTVRSKVSNLQTLKTNYSDYTRTQENEIDSQFQQLPNPSIVMYIFPHATGEGYSIMPVPGYSTVFPLYTHVMYVMPGEIEG